MHNLEKKLREAVTHIRLTEKERFERAAALATFIDAHPMTQTVDQRHTPSRFPLFRIFALHPIIAGILLLLLVTSSVSYAAEYALPGDTLYPMKVSVNEEVVRVFARNDEQKAEFEANRIARRFEEAEHVVLNKKADEKAVQDIERQLAKHNETIRGHLYALQAGGETADASSILDSAMTTVTAHERILAKIATTDLTAQEQVRLIQLSVDTLYDELVEIRTILDEKLPSEEEAVLREGAESLRQDLEENLADLTQHLTKKDLLLADEDFESLSNTLEGASILYMEGESALGANNLVGALEAFGAARDSIDTLLIIIESEERLDIDLIEATVQGTTTASLHDPLE